MDANKVEEYRARKDAELSKQMKKADVWSIFWVSLIVLIFLAAFSIVMLSKVGNKINTLDSEDLKIILTVIVPVFAVVMAFVVSAAGMKRLQMYDNEFARMRQERREDAKELRGEIENRLDEVDRKVGKIARNTKNSILNEIKKEVDKKLKESINNAKEIEKNIIGVHDEMNKRYGDYIKLGNLQNMESGRVLSVGEMIRIINRSFSKEERAEAVGHVETLLKKAEKREVAGTPVDWFNLSTKLGQENQEELAYRICKVALEVYRGDMDWEDYRPNLDLLAHGIQYAGKVAHYDDAEKWLLKAEEIGREHWGWRLFTFVGQYYLERGMQDKFEEIIKDFKKHLPHEERCVTMPADYLVDRGRYEDARKIIEKWIQDREKVKGCPPRADGSYLTLSRIAVAQGDWDAALKYTWLTLQSAVVDQPTANLSAAWFFRGAGYDGLLMQELGKDKPDEGRAKMLYERAFNSYARCIDHPQTSSVTRDQATRRTEDMKFAMKEKGISVDVSESENDGIQSGDLIKFTMLASQEYDESKWKSFKEEVSYKFKELWDAETIQNFANLLTALANDEDTPLDKKARQRLKEWSQKLQEMMAS